jgi:hypothetical protein
MSIYTLNGTLMAREKERCNFMHYTSLRTLETSWQREKKGTNNSE